MASGDGQRTMEIAVARDRLPYFVAAAATDVRIRRVDVFGAPADRDPALDPDTLTLPALTIAGQAVNAGDASPLGTVVHALADGLGSPIPQSAQDAAATWMIAGSAGELRQFRDVCFVVTYSADVAVPPDSPVA
jgi:hypothetical protein